MDLALQLRKVETMLQEAVEKGKEKLQLIDSASKGANVEDLVAYAHKISATTSGPSGWSPEQGPLLPMYRPPAPQEDEMRSGILYAKALAAATPTTLTTKL